MGIKEAIAFGQYAGHESPQRILAERVIQLERINTKLREKVKNQAERIRFFEGATNHAGGIKHTGCTTCAPNPHCLTSNPAIAHKQIHETSGTKAGYSL
jgi:hypothetical protein